MWKRSACLAGSVLALGWLTIPPVAAQQVDDTQLTQPVATPDAVIQKSLTEQIGAGQGDVDTPDSSIFVIKRDPFRSIRRGRQLFQRKFGLAQGLGPRTGDGIGDVTTDLSIGAGLADSCAACHGRPRGSAGSGGDVQTRPDSRDAPHLFGLGLVEMLGDEITQGLRAIRDEAVDRAQTLGHPVSRSLVAKGIHYGTIKALPDGSVDTSQVTGVDPDLRVRPFFHQGGTISIREFVVGALNAEMGLEAHDPVLAAAVAGGQAVTPSGMVLDGSLDTIEAPPAAGPADDPDGDGIVDEVDPALVDHLEFYLLNYFKPGLDRQDNASAWGRYRMDQLGCTSCHIADLVIENDRRVADVETVYDPQNGIFNRLFATATARLVEVDDGSGHPTIKNPSGDTFVVRNIFADFKRHDLGPNFWERNFDGTIQKEFLTEPLWGVATTGPYGHDGRSISLRNVILRHGGEAQASRNAFAGSPRWLQNQVLAFLETLVLFPPDDTASNLNPGDRSDPLFPQSGHGNIALGVLFNDPTDVE